jgi:hypothetical protein
MLTYNDKYNLSIINDQYQQISSAIVITLLYAMIILIGLITNLFVIYRMRRLAIVDIEQYLNGTGICLYSMAIADIISLTIIFAHICLQIVANFTDILIDTSTLLMNCVCKVNTIMYCNRTRISANQPGIKHFGTYPSLTVSIPIYFSY